MRSRATVLYLNLLVVLLSALGGTSAQAQCQKAGITGVLADPTTQTISLRFDLPVTDKDSKVKLASSWNLVDLSKEPPADPNQPPPPRPSIDTVTLERPDQFTKDYITAELHYDRPLNANHKYLLVILDMSFNECQPNKVVSAVVESAVITPTQIEAKTRFPIVPAPSKGRDDSDLYISGLLEGAKKKSATKVIDARVALNIPKIFFGRSRDIVPFADLKMSTNVGANADSLKLGLLVRSAYNTSQRMRESLGVTNYVWETEGRIESDPLFRNTNLVWGNTLYYLPKTIGSGAAQLSLLPFTGLEMGGNLKRPGGDMGDQGIVRATAGASAAFNFFNAKKQQVPISFQADYIRRWPLLSEFNFVKDAKSELVPLFSGTRPREYIQAKVIFSFNEFFGLTLNFDHGELPPSYLKVNRKYSVGLYYRTKLLFRP